MPASNPLFVFKQGCCAVWAAYRAVPVEQQAVQAPDGVILAIDLAQLELHLQQRQR
jgi:hypothetical protein